MQYPKERLSLLNALCGYQEQILSVYFQNHAPSYLAQTQILAEFISFVEKEEHCFERHHTPGHLTGSALVTNFEYTHVLFTYHAKLKKWLQLGGHCDGDNLVHRVALREAQEESGIHELFFVNEFSGLPFDIDIHTIPASEREPEHLHYDVRYLLQTHLQNQLCISQESLDLKWIALSDVTLYTQEPSTLRQIEKLKHFMRERN